MGGNSYNERQDPEHGEQHANERADDHDRIRRIVIWLVGLVPLVVLHGTTKSHESGLRFVRCTVRELLKEGFGL
jgi:hypothetical protein